MRYEIWHRHLWGNQFSGPEEILATLDMAMIRAVDLSKSNNITFVLDKNQNPSVVRGFGMNGKWLNAVDCKKCNNSTSDDDCRACMQASWKHF